MPRLTAKALLRFLDRLFCVRSICCFGLVKRLNLDLSDLVCDLSFPFSAKSLRISAIICSLYFLSIVAPAVIAFAIELIFLFILSISLRTPSKPTSKIFLLSISGTRVVCGSKPEKPKFLIPDKTL